MLDCDRSLSEPRGAAQGDERLGGSLPRSSTACQGTESDLERLGSLERSRSSIDRAQTSGRGGVTSPRPFPFRSDRGADSEPTGAVEPADLSLVAAIGPMPYNRMTMPRRHRTTDTTGGTVLSRLDACTGRRQPWPRL